MQLILTGNNFIGSKYIKIKWFKIDWHERESNLFAETEGVMFNPEIWNMVSILFRK